MAENKMTKEVLKAAKGTGSVEELQKLAKENGMELDAAQAEEMYARLHPVTQELSDDELDNVTGGDSCARNAEVRRLLPESRFMAAPM